MHGMHGVIDIGSNSVLLLVAQRGAEGALTIATDRATVTRVSEGAGASGLLSEAAIERTLAVLAEYRAEADRRKVQTLSAVATEGVRMARNADAFLEPAARILGAPVRVVSGEEEARLSYRSVALEEAGPLRVVDIGGASTELCVGTGLEVHDVRSHPIGSVRLTEACVADPRQPISVAELEAIDARCREVLALQPVEHSPDRPVLHGLAGTVTTSAALMLGLVAYDRDRVHGSEFGVEQVRALRDELAAEPAPQRIVRPSLSPKRADVIVTGITILLAVMAHVGATRLAVRDRGLRYALIPGPGSGRAGATGARA